eukprot:JP435711.1.p1 GENE.JP435711.1~~JP435711.1.p1  ORF type:complete len:502 (-),score=69.82 JP435711.1:291-1763(-)
MIDCKVFFNEEVRRLKLDEAVSFEDLRASLTQRFGVEDDVLVCHDGSVLSSQTFQDVISKSSKTLRLSLALAPVAQIHSSQWEQIEDLMSCSETHSDADSTDHDCGFDVIPRDNDRTTVDSEADSAIAVVCTAGLCNVAIDYVEDLAASSVFTSDTNVAIKSVADPTASILCSGNADITITSTEDLTGCTSDADVAIESSADHIVCTGDVGITVESMEMEVLTGCASDTDVTNESVADPVGNLDVTMECSTSDTDATNETVADPSDSLHYQVACSLCCQFPITGSRYKCTVCKIFNLCPACESLDQHPPSHPMLKFFLPDVESEGRALSSRGQHEPVKAECGSTDQKQYSNTQSRGRRRSRGPRVAQEEKQEKSSWGPRPSFPLEMFATEGSFNNKMNRKTQPPSKNIPLSHIHFPPLGSTRKGNPKNSKLFVVPQEPHQTLLPQQPLPPQFHDEQNTLVDMGFADVERNHVALTAAKGDVELALAILVA